MRLPHVRKAAGVPDMVPRHKRTYRLSVLVCVACLQFAAAGEAGNDLPGSDLAEAECDAYILGDVRQWNAGGVPFYEVFVVVPDWVEDYPVTVELGSDTTGVHNCWNVHDWHIVGNSLHLKLGAWDRKNQACVPTNHSQGLRALI